MEGEVRLSSEAPHSASLTEPPSRPVMHTEHEQYADAQSERQPGCAVGLSDEAGAPSARLAVSEAGAARAQQDPANDASQASHEVGSAAGAPNQLSPELASIALSLESVSLHEHTSPEHEAGTGAAGGSLEPGDTGVDAGGGVRGPARNPGAASSAGPPTEKVRAGLTARRSNSPATHAYFAGGGAEPGHGLMQMAAARVTGADEVTVR